MKTVFTYAFKIFEVKQIEYINIVIFDKLMYWRISQKTE